MHWLLFSFLSVIAFSLAAIFRRVVMKDDKTDAVASSIVFQILGGVIIGIIAFGNGFILPPFAPYLLNYFLVGILWALATVCQFKAYQYLEASEAIIISTLETVVIIIAANFFLGEFFTLQMAIGTLLILGGVVLISKTKKKLSFNKGVSYTLGFCLFAGLGAVNDTYMVKSVDALSYLAIGFLLPGLFLMVLRPQAIPAIKTFFVPATFIKIFLLTVFYSLGAIAFVFAITAGAQVSQLSPISNASIIMTVLLATIFLNERDHLLRKIICTVLVFLGVFLLR